RPYARSRDDGVCQELAAEVARGSGGVLAGFSRWCSVAFIHATANGAPFIAPPASAPTMTVTAITITPSTSTVSNRSTAVTAPPRAVGECLSKRTRTIDQDCALRFSPAR